MRSRTHVAQVIVVIHYIGAQVVPISDPEYLGAVPGIEPGQWKQLAPAYCQREFTSEAESKRAIEKTKISLFAT